LFDPEDGGDMFLRKIGWHSTEYMASYPRRYSSISIYSENQMEQINIVCEQQAEFFNVKADGMYSNHGVLKCLNLVSIREADTF
jgi:hypothetical protein